MSRVLITEDSATQAGQITFMLEDEGYETATASNGKAALKIIPNFQPDVILTDMEMPEMDGLQLVDAVRLQYPTVPIVLMTSRGTDEIAVDALARGAAAYVPKSLLESNLLGTLSQVLRMARADRSYSKLVSCLDRNEFEFTLDSDPNLIEPLVDLMQQMLSGMELCDPSERVQVGMALEHALLNAVCRGNLEITRAEMDEERDLLIEGIDTSLADERQAVQPYCNRRILFQVRMSRDEATFFIRDDGPGFDTSILPDPGEPGVLEREGGRGLVLMQTFMDDVAFSEKGNEVTLIKRRKERLS